MRPGISAAWKCRWCGWRGSARPTTYAFFWLLMPVVGLIEKPKPLPESIAQSVLGKPQAE